MSRALLQAFFWGLKVANEGGLDRDGWTCNVFRLGQKVRREQVAKIMSPRVETALNVYRDYSILYGQECYVNVSIYFGMIKGRSLSMRRNSVT